MTRGTTIIMAGIRPGIIDMDLGTLDFTTLSYLHGDGMYILTFTPIVAGMVVDIMWDMVATTVDMVVTDMAMDLMMAIMRD